MKIVAPAVPRVLGQLLMPDSYGWTSNDIIGKALSSGCLPPRPVPLSCTEVTCDPIPADYDSDMHRDK